MKSGFFISCFVAKYEIRISKKLKTKFRFPNQKHPIIPFVCCQKFIRKYDCITYRGRSDLITHDDFFSSGSAPLFLALFVTFQILPSMRALPIDCQKNTAVCLEEIMKELTQVRFEVNILAENRTSLTCK